MYRRMMVGSIVDPTAQVVAIVLTALEEAVLRSTMVARDTYVAKLRDGRDMTGPELEQQRRVWAASSASSMYIELVSIITCRVMYVLFHPHRFVINFGYSSAAMASVATMSVALFGEIVFEVIVDAFALDVESRNGIDLGNFWSMWRMNPGKRGYTGLCLSSIIESMLCYLPFPLSSLCLSWQLPLPAWP